MESTIFNDCFTHKSLKERQSVLLSLAGTLDFGRTISVYEDVIGAINAAVGRQFAAIALCDNKNQQTILDQYQYQPSLPSVTERFDQYLAQAILVDHVLLYPELARRYFSSSIPSGVTFVPNPKTSCPNNGHTVRGAYDHALYNVALYNWCILVARIIKQETGFEIPIDFYLQRLVSIGKMLSLANLLDDDELKKFSTMLMLKTYCYTDPGRTKFQIMGLFADFGNPHSHYLTNDAQSFRDDLNKLVEEFNK